jgi:hypothetical protein
VIEDRRRVADQIIELRRRLDALVEDRGAGDAVPG